MALWKQLSVPPSSSIEEAIRCINEGGMQIALVVDAADKLLGVVTDGDIRRALLRHETLSSPVSSVMSMPLTVPLTASKRQILGLMKARKISHIPVVDLDGRVVAVEFLREQFESPKFDNTVFLMAGGFGKRLRPLTDTMPKPMLKVSGKPILENIIMSLAAQGFSNFCIAVHYMADKIKDYFGDGSRWNVKIRYVEETSPLGTAGALSMLDNTGGLPVLVMNADLLNQVNFAELIQFHERSRATATLCGQTQTYQVPYGVIETDGHKVQSIVEKPVYRHLISAGIYVLSPQVIAAIEPGQPLDMPELLQYLIDEEQPVHVFPIYEYWLDIGRPEDFDRASHDFPGALS